MSNLADLEKHEREARRNSIYNHPSTIKLREDSKRAVGPNHIGIRQADERGAMERRHHAEGQKLSGDQRIERDKYQSKPQPADLNKNQQKARKDLETIHLKERQTLRERHLRQRDQALRRGSLK